MNIKVLVACLISAVASFVINLLIMNYVEGTGRGLLMYQAITVVFVGLIIGVIFGENMDTNPLKKKYVESLK
jgi:hypothetical protein